MKQVSLLALTCLIYSHLAPRKIDVISSLSMMPNTLDLAMKADKKKVALSRIFLRCLGLYGEVQDMSL